VLLAAVLCCAGVVWWAFESRTNEIRRWVERRLSGDSPLPSEKPRDHKCV
jgi:hypothetical protein